MDNELYHYGIIGQKWGVRRFQNKDGTLTPAGRKRAAKLESEYEKVTGKKLNNGGSSSSSNTKSIKDMTDDEIRSRISRIKLENELNSLTPEQVSKGKAFVDGAKDVAVSALKEASKTQMTKFLNKNLSKVLGTDVEDPYDILKKEVDTLDLKKRKLDAEEYIRTFAQKQQTDDLRRASQNASSAKNIYTAQEFFKNEQKRKEKEASEASEASDAARKVYEATGQSYVNKFLLENKKKR